MTPPKVSIIAAKPLVEAEPTVQIGGLYHGVKGDCLKPYKGGVVDGGLRLNFNLGGNNPESMRRLRVIAEGGAHWEFNTGEDFSLGQCVSEGAERTVPSLVVYKNENNENQDGQDGEVTEEEQPTRPSFPGQDDTIEQQDPEMPEAEESTERPSTDGPPVIDAGAGSAQQRLSLNAFGGRVKGGLGFDFLPWRRGDNEYFLGVEALAVGGWGKYVGENVAILDSAHAGTNSVPTSYTEKGFELGLPLTLKRLRVGYAWSRVWRSNNAENPLTGQEINDTTTVVDTHGLRVGYRFGLSDEVPPDPKVPPPCNDFDDSALKSTATGWRNRLFVDGDPLKGLKPEVAEGLRAMQAQEYFIETLGVSVQTVQVKNGSGNWVVEPRVVLVVPHPQFKERLLVVYKDDHQPLSPDDLEAMTTQDSETKVVEAAKEAVTSTFKPGIFQCTVNKPTATQVSTALGKVSLADYERYLRTQRIFKDFNAARANLHETAAKFKELIRAGGGDPANPDHIVQFYLRATASVEGDEEKNLTLSHYRAQLVAAWFGKLGVKTQGGIGTGEDPRFLAEPGNVDDDARSRIPAEKERAEKNRVVEIIWGPMPEGDPVDLLLSGETNSAAKTAKRETEFARLQTHEAGLKDKKTLTIVTPGVAPKVVKTSPVRFHGQTYLGDLSLLKIPAPEGQTCSPLGTELHYRRSGNATLFGSHDYLANSPSPTNDMAPAVADPVKPKDAEDFETTKTDLTRKVLLAIDGADQWMTNNEAGTLSDKQKVRAALYEAYRLKKEVAILQTENQRLIDNAHTAPEDTFDTNIALWFSNDEKHRVAFKQPLYADRNDLNDIQKKLDAYIAAVWEKFDELTGPPPAPTAFTVTGTTVAGNRVRGTVTVAWDGPVPTDGVIVRSSASGTDKTGGQPGQTGQDVTFDATAKTIEVKYSGFRAGTAEFSYDLLDRATSTKLGTIKLIFTGTGASTTTSATYTPAAPAAGAGAAPAAGAPAAGSAGYRE